MSAFSRLSLGLLLLACSCLAQVITTVAVTTWVYSINGPRGLAVDGAGNVFFSEGNTVKRHSPSGSVTTVAGTGVEGFSGDNGPATAAKLSQPEGLAVDSSGNLLIADYGNGRVRK